MVLINDLLVGFSLVKYVDDSTLSEQIKPKSQASDMLQFLRNLHTWTADNHMQVNSAKTKEMILAPLFEINLPLLTTSSGTIERVSSFKLLGVHVDSFLTIPSVGQSTSTALFKKLLLESTFWSS